MTASFSPPPQDLEIRFWTSRIAFSIYGNVLIALLFRQLWILYGVAFIITAQIALVFGKWVAFVESDPQYNDFLKFMRQNLRVVLDEYDKVTNGHYGAARLAVGRAAAQASMRMTENILRTKGSLQSMRHALEMQLKEHKTSSSAYQAFNAD